MVINMHDIWFEVKKLRGVGLFVGGILFTFLMTSFQGYAALVTEEISWEILHITAMDFFSTFIYPLLISFIVIRGFSVEKQNSGFLNYYSNNISLKKMYGMKIATSYLVGVLFLLEAFIITAIYIYIKGGNVIYVYMSNWKFVFLYIMAMGTVINIMGILCICIKNQLIPGVIAIIAVVFGSVTNVMGISYINPWGYFESSFYYRGLDSVDKIAMFIVFGLSVLVLSCKINRILHSLVDAV